MVQPDLQRCPPPLPPPRNCSHWETKRYQFDQSSGKTGWCRDPSHSYFFERGSSMKEPSDKGDPPWRAGNPQIELGAVIDTWRSLKQETPLQGSNESFGSSNKKARSLKPACPHWWSKISSSTRIKILVLSNQFQTMTKISLLVKFHPREKMCFFLKNIQNFVTSLARLRACSPGCQFPSPSVAAVWQSAELVISSAPNLQTLSSMTTESRLGNDFLVGEFKKKTWCRVIKFLYRNPCFPQLFMGSSFHSQVVICHSWITEVMITVRVVLLNPH